MAVSPSSPLPHFLCSSPHFPSIQEEETGKNDEQSTEAAPYSHHPTPIHPSNPPPATASPPPLPPTTKYSRRGDLSVSCSKCRPSSRDKISGSGAGAGAVAPLDQTAPNRSSVSGHNHNNLLRSIFGAISRKTPSHIPTTPSPSSSSGDWKLAAAELSKKLLHVTRKRDEALLESSRLKYSMSELEQKLNRLESYCRDLRAALDRCAAGPTPSTAEPFRAAVSNARSAVRHLSRSLLSLLRASPRSMDRLAALLPSGGRQNPGNLVIGLESALNRVFYTDFEHAGDGEGMVPDPSDRCAANRAAYDVVRGLTWEDVLSRGTRHYSEGLSRFCDWKMSEVVELLGCARAWPEALLQAFFGAARGVWVVYLLARSVHPALPILRVDPGAKFDPRYMENVDVAGGSPENGELTAMVAPGFYIHATGCSVVKCRVVVAACAERGGNAREDGPENARVGG